MIEIDEDRVAGEDERELIDDDEGDDARMENEVRGDAGRDDPRGVEAEAVLDVEVDADTLEEERGVNVGRGERLPVDEDDGSFV